MDQSNRLYFILILCAYFLLMFIQFFTLKLFSRIGMIILSMVAIFIVIKDLRNEYNNRPSEEDYTGLYEIA